MQKQGIICAILAAGLYALSTPVSKYLLEGIDSSMLASLLYLGAGIGMLVLLAFNRGSKEAPLSKSDLPYTIGMILLDIAAPLLMMAGLNLATPESVSLLNNFEIVATALIARLLFGEKISGRLWLAIGLITVATLLLSMEEGAGFRISAGSLLVLGACCCWGLENNCTRALSDKNPMQIVAVKGVFSGLGALIVALLAGSSFPTVGYLGAALLLGFLAYGLSIFFYVHAQRRLGAAKTSAFYAVSPFIGSVLSLLIFPGIPGILFWAALAVMAVGSFFACEPKK